MRRKATSAILVMALVSMGAVGLAGSATAEDMDEEDDELWLWASADTTQYYNSHSTEGWCWLHQGFSASASGSVALVGGTYHAWGEGSKVLDRSDEAAWPLDNKAQVSSDGVQEYTVRQEEKNWVRSGANAHAPGHTPRNALAIEDSASCEDERSDVNPARHIARIGIVADVVATGNAT